MNDKNLKKLTINSTYVQNFSQFEELQILGPNLPRKYELKEFSKNKH